MGNNFHTKLWHIITHLYPNFHLATSTLKLARVCDYVTLDFSLQSLESGFSNDLPRCFACFVGSNAASDFPTEFIGEPSIGVFRFCFSLRN